MTHDIFISHSTQDRQVANLICAELENAGLTCWIAPRDIDGGEAWDEAILHGLDNARQILLVFSEVSIESIHVKREILRALEKKKALLPVRIQNVPAGRLEYILTGIQWFDAFAAPFETYLPALKQQVIRILEQRSEQKSPSASSSSIRAAVTGNTESSSSIRAAVAPANADKNKKTIAMIYKRHSEPDGYVLQLLENHFRNAGYNVFVDRHMQIGVEWAHEIERNIKMADAVIPILSEASIQSEMVNYEVEIARSAGQSQQGKPRILPVRINYQGSLGETLDAILKPLQYALWTGEKDDAAVIKQLTEALTSYEQPDPEAIRKEQPGGAIPITSKFYIPRPSDDALSQALARKDTIVLVKGGRQMGKTSLVARGLQQARASGATVVYTDLQKLNSSDLSGIQPFYFALAHMLADQLGIDTDIDDTWKDRRAPSVNFEQYIKSQVMPKVHGHMFWALDEVDRLFTTDFGSEVFGLFRSWHNERASNPDTPWSSLTLIISYATEAHLFIADPNQSPFNVGTRLELRDFNLDQEEVLNKLYGSPLLNDEQIAHFNELVSGQPYLTGRGLHELAVNKMPFEEFAAAADRDEGPFGDHLRRILVMLARDQRMVDAVRSVLTKNNELSMESFYRLRAAGIVVGDGAFNVKMRCKLYAKYLEGHLRESA